MTTAPSPVAALPPREPVYVPLLHRLLPVLLDVPEAGELAGMSRARAYVAAHDGAIPTIRMGHRLRVPTTRWLDVLGLSYTSEPATSEDVETGHCRLEPSGPVTDGQVRPLSPP